MRIGPVVISIGTTDAQWEEDLAIIRTMKPDLIKLPIETAFTPYPHRIRAVVDELKPKTVVMSTGMEAILGGWPAVQQLVGQQRATIEAHPDITFCIEIGNEPEYHDPPWGGTKDAQYFYRYQILTLAKLLKEWGPPNLKVGASMPVRLDHARDVVFAGDEWGRVVDAVDYLCTHYYGYEYIGDGAGNGKDHNAAWGPIYEMLKGTACKILFTEIGIDSPSSTLETKSLRLLKWLEEQPEQVAGAAIWCVGPWRNMGLDVPGASVYGNRRRQPVPTPPPTKETPVRDRPYHVAISYGHNNNDGGNPFEAKQTPQLGRAVADACRSLGMEVRVVQDEYDTSRMGLQGVAEKVVGWHRAGWPVDLYLETHTEGGGPNARGVFAIYPDTGDDSDKDALRIGQDAAKRIAEAVNIPLRANGIMSERITGVGSQGYRLGIFLKTAAIKGDTTRMIIEYGSHDNQADVNAIMGNLPAVGMATAQAFAAEARRLGFPLNEHEAEYQSVKPDAFTAPTGKTISGGFLAFWRSLDANQINLRVLGYPVTQEFIAKLDGQPQDFTYQCFERGTLTWRGGNQTPWDVYMVTADEDAVARAYAKEHGLLA